MGEGGGFLLFVGTILGLPPMLILLTALLPGYVERARGVMRDRPGRSFLLGLLNLVFFGVLSMLVGVGFAPIALTGAFSAFVLLPVCMVLGLLIAAGFAGEQILLQVASRTGSLLGSVALGIVVLILSLLLPVVGFLVFVVLMTIGLGAAIFALFRRKQQEQPEPSAAEDLE
jgi:hypothetical protein